MIFLNFILKYSNKLVRFLLIFFINFDTYATKCTGSIIVDITLAVFANRGTLMEETHRKKSLFLSFLMLTSVMVGLVGLMPTAVAANETTSGTITGTEVWSGSHTLTAVSYTHLRAHET